LSQKDSVIGNVIAPGSPDDSKLFHAISGPEPEMPKTGKQLTPEQVSIVRDWIAAGANWPTGRVLIDNPERDLDWWSLKSLITKQATVEDSTGSGPSPNPAGHRPVGHRPVGHRPVGGHRPSPVRSVAGVCEAGRHDLFVMSIQSGLTEASYRCCGSEL
jgi:hypothetical protein